ncbi:MAG TPA: SUF system NifU family Fe-S cluster assembly protein [Trueperaceae bacterium]|nr:SUF system NifU family Fe-S cluster assembly protein [Trueperaceae bacterium]
MGVLDDLYQSAILDHSRHPRNHGELDEHHVAQEGLNPSCGDELTLYLRVDGGRVAAASFVGEGCAISQAASSLMTEAITGLELAAAHELAQRFKAMIRGLGADESLGESRVLQGIAKLPARVKCATLPWVTLELALSRFTERAD